MNHTLSNICKHIFKTYSIEAASIISTIIELLADTTDPLVTATHAIFIGKGHKAPAAVVGLQFQHSSLATHFVNITSTVSRRIFPHVHIIIAQNMYKFVFLVYRM